MHAITSFFKDPTKAKFYKISGEATFAVDVSIQGEAPYSSCILTVNTFNDLTRRIAIAAKYKWFRVYKTSKKQVKSAGNTYHVSPLDIGAKIMVEIFPIEEGEEGTAQVYFGPFSLDPGMKKTLQGIIRSGGTRFIVDNVNSADDSSSHNTSKSMSISQMQPGHIVLFKNSFKITPENSNGDLRVGLGEQFETVPGPGQKCITFIFRNRSEDIAKLFSSSDVRKSVRGKNQNKVICKLISRSARDILVMSLRCFEAQLSLEDSIVFEKMKKQIHDDMSEDKKKMIEMITDRDQMEREIEFLYQNNMKLEKQNSQLRNTVRNLEGELSRSVNCKKSKFCQIFNFF